MPFIKSYLFYAERTERGLSNMSLVDRLMTTSLPLTTLTLLSAALVLVSGEYKLTILHTNDVHARIDEAYKYGGVCSASDSAAGKCVGGSSRL